MTHVDLNCDLGEGCGDDAAILPHITSASVACGQHAGDPLVMWATIVEARRRGVAIGAHPGYPDRVRFGRAELALTLPELEAVIAYQIGACAAVARQAGLPLQHLKAHGALYHVTAHRPAEAAVLVAAAVQAGVAVIIGPPRSALADVAKAAGLSFAAEAFPDRNYAPDGSLLARSDPRALFEGDDETIAARAVDMVIAKRVLAVDGTAVPVTAHTLCLHGDDPRAAGRARAIRAALVDAGIAVAPLEAWLGR